MNRIIFYLAIGLSALSLSCTKWTDPSAVVVQDLNYNQYGNASYQEYLKNLKVYKNSKHSVLLGFVGNWDVNSFSNKLTTLPDSVDMVALLSAPASPSEAQLADIKKIQTEKGTKVLFYLNSKMMSDSIRNNPAMFPGGDSAAILSYVNKITDQINKTGYDGIVVNMEGHVCFTCNTVFTAPRKTSYLISLLSKIAGPQSGTTKALLVQGEPKDVGIENSPNFNYFIANTNTTKFYYELSALYDLFKTYNSFSTDKMIVTVDFKELETSKIGGSTFYTSATGTTQPASIALAKWNPADGKKGGLGIYYFENDFANSFYSYSRSAIGIQNPPVK